MQVSVSVDGIAAPESEERATFVAIVGPGYFETIGARLVAGRFIDDRDRPGSPPVTVVNESFVRRYLAGSNPVGRRITLPVAPRETFEVVGVVGDITQFAVETAAEPNVYLSDRHRRSGGMAIVARATVDPSTLLPSARERALRADPFAPVTRLETMEHAVSRAIALPRFYTMLLTIFATVAMAMAAIGLYGVMSYSVSRRAYEIGMRLSLGATPAHIRRMVVAQGMALSALGMVLGLGAALALTQVLRTLLFGVTASDPLTFLVIALVLAVIALAACWLPARRATKIDPMTSLRSA
jgi:putative ABC transport system permease protein